jgi:oligopeptide/dipeptide ABC transporter ATP-binding protein
MADAPKSAAPLVEAREVSRIFAAKSGVSALAGTRYVRAVDRVSLAIERAETVGLVGESGCGKSTLGRVMIGLERPSAGSVVFDGVDLTALPARKLRRSRRHMQIILQDPASSLDPRYTVRDTIAEALRAHHSRLPRRKLAANLAALLDMVGLPLASLDRLPHELSNGERQRIAIARALAVTPRFIVADEPVASLDVATQAQIVGLLADLQRELGVAFLLIAHDLDVVRFLCRRVAVMYLGRIVELAPVDALFDRSRHPYTRALMAAVLSPDPDLRREPVLLHGDPPSPLEPPKGCHFHPRCRHAQVRCSLLGPDLREAAPGHLVACHFDL